MALLGITVPILQAPTGIAAGSQLAAAISNAGAMGALALTGRDALSTRAIVAETRRLTSRPFLVNYILRFEPETLQTALDAGASVVQFSWGLPTPAILGVIRRAGAKVGVQIGNAEGARAVLDLGVDYVVSQGTEAGGHVQSSTSVADLLSQVLAVAGGRPVVAAGGIGNGAAMRQALLSGASGVVIGTRFVATRESLAHDDYKQAIVRATAKDTALTLCFQDGWVALHRCIRNSTLVRWEAAGCPDPGKRPGEGEVLASRSDGRKVLRYGIGGGSNQDAIGTITDTPLMAGTSVEAVRDVPPAGSLVARLWRECLDAV